VFLSSTTNSLDTKGRVSVPANFRSLNFANMLAWMEKLHLLAVGVSLKFGMKRLMRRAVLLCAKRL